MRPTLEAAACLLLGAALIIAGGGFEQSAITATGIGLIAISIIDALASLAPRINLASAQRHPTLFPRHFSTAERWEQLDQNDDVIRSFTGPPPATRGVFRSTGSLLRWTSPFGMWTCVARLRDNQTVVHTLKESEENGEGAASIDASGVRRPRALGPYEDDSTFSTRPYVPGDPQRSISWTASARHGELMTRVADRRKQPRLLIIVDTLTPAERSDRASGSMPDDDFERLIGHVGRIVAMRRPNDAEIVLTDGHALAQTPQSIECFLAAAWPSTQGSAENRADHISDFLSQPNVYGLFVTPETQSMEAFESALSDTGVLRAMEIIRTETIEPKEESAEVSERTSSPVSRLRSRANWPRSRARRRRATATTWTPQEKNSSKAHAFIPRALTCVATAFLLIVALVQLRELFGSQHWLTFALIATAAVSLDAAAAHTRKRKALVHILITSGALLVAGIATMTGFLYSSTHLWWFTPLAGLSASASGTIVSDGGGDSLAASTLSDWGATNTWDVLGTVAGKGINALLYQSFPVQASVSLDITMVLVCMGLIVIRALLAVRQLRPLCAAAPLIIFAARAELFGDTQPTLLIAGVLFAFLVLLWSSQKMPMLWPQPLTFAAATTVAALVLAPLATSGVQALDLPFGTQAGLFSSNAVNPLVDLSRNLRGNSSSVALSYQPQNGAQYIRLASLDNFDGNTWSFDQAQSDNAVIDASADTPGEYSISLPYTDDSPLAQYNQAALDSGIMRGGESTATSAKITIETLTSRYMPLVGLPSAVYPAKSGWRWSADGTAYSQTQHVESGDDYYARGAYVEPITKRSELAQTTEWLNGLISDSGTELANSAAGGRDEGAGEHNEDTGTDRQMFSIDTEAAATAKKYAHNNYVDLPEKLPSSVRKVVTAAKEAGATSDSTSAKQQESALGYLLDFFENGDFTYSLTAPDGNGSNNMDVIGDFLVRRSGYCVHYATSFAVLARALNVPTRVIMGYLPSSAGKYPSGAYPVTNQQLHAWAEAYIDGIGWVPFDVTPASDAAAESSTSTSANTDDNKTSDTKSSDTSDDTDSRDSQDSSTSTSADGNHSKDDEKDTSSTGEDASGAAAAGSLSPVARVALTVVGVVLLLGIIAALPWEIRRLRRRRRLRAIAQLESGTKLGVGAKPSMGVGAGAKPGTDPADASADGASAAYRATYLPAYLAAWHEVLDTAHDVGLRLPGSATEMTLAQMIDDAIGEGGSADVARLARIVQDARYGNAELASSSTSAEILSLVKVANAQLWAVAPLPRKSKAEKSRRAPRWVRSAAITAIRVKRMLLPASVLHRRRGAK
jgi:transglutaminase-like putative cysteine protease